MVDSNQNKRSIYVGLFITIGLLLLIAGILLIGNLHKTFIKKIELVSFFDDVNGLQKGSNVWFSGVKIGTVTGLKFSDKNRVTVFIKIELKAQQYVRKDALVKISTDGLIGNKMLVITGGTAAYEEVLEGDTLGVEKTFTNEEMLNTLQENNKNLLLITNDVKTIVANIAQGNGSLGKFIHNDDLYLKVDNTASLLEQSAQNTQKITKSLAKLSEGLNKKGAFIYEMVNDTNLYGQLTQLADNLEQSSVGANKLLNTLSHSAKDTSTMLGVLLYHDPSAFELKETIHNLNEGSLLLNEDLKAAQHNFLLKGYFKKMAKQTKKK